MTEFATAEELGVYRGRAPLPDERAQLELVIRLASAAIQAYARQQFELVIDDEIELAPQSGPDLWLPERPVLAVGQLSIDGLVADGYEFDRRGRVRWRLGDIWQSRYLDAPGPWTPVVTVTYSHGYALSEPLPDPNPLGIELLPDKVRGVCLQAAKRLLDNPGSISSETLGRYSVTYAGSARSGVELSGAERRSLRRYRQSFVSARTG